MKPEYISFIEGIGLDEFLPRARVGFWRPNQLRTLAARAPVRGMPSERGGSVIMRSYVNALVSLAAAIGIHASPGEANLSIGTEVGQVYPNYILPSLSNGRPVALSQFRGRKIILLQFASW